MEPNEHLTRILNQAQDGDPRAEAMMWDLVMHDLRQIASRVASDSDGDARQRANSAGGAPHAAASETTIVNEAFLRVFGQAQVEPWQSRRHLETVNFHSPAQRKYGPIFHHGRGLKH